jgi:hypothetical protein
LAFFKVLFFILGLLRNWLAFCLLSILTTFNDIGEIADLFVMKKIYRRSQQSQVIGRTIRGREMYKYGLPYDGATGAFSVKNSEHVDLMLAAVERHSEIHIVSRWCVSGSDVS